MLEDAAVHMGQCDCVSDKQNIFKTPKRCMLRRKTGEPLLKKVGLIPEIWQFWKEVALTVDRLPELWQRGKRFASDSSQSSLNSQGRSRKWLSLHTLRSSTSLYCQKNLNSDTSLQRNLYIFTRWKCQVLEGQIRQKWTWKQGPLKWEIRHMFFKLKVIKILAQTTPGGSSFL